MSKMGSALHRAHGLLGPESTGWEPQEAHTTACWVGQSSLAWGIREGIPEE